jgi:hypothetical protein
MHWAIILHFIRRPTAHEHNTCERTRYWNVKVDMKHTPSAPHRRNSPAQAAYEAQRQVVCQFTRIRQQLILVPIHACVHHRYVVDEIAVLPQSSLYVQLRACAVCGRAAHQRTVGIWITRTEVHRCSACRLHQVNQFEPLIGRAEIGIKIRSWHSKLSKCDVMKSHKIF